VFFRNFLETAGDVIYLLGAEAVNTALEPLSLPPFNTHYVPLFKFFVEEKTSPGMFFGYLVE
jgi:hypothetical protein